ncbi:MAG: hypothetical protein ABII07_02605 [Patescibacteria group bacterium]|nr:hypothetical protein [Patescibacteria group bacterium]
MKKLIAILFLTAFFAGCQPVATPNAEVDYNEAVLGTWMMTLTSSAPNVTIEGPITFHEDGTATGEYGNVAGCDNNSCFSGSTQFTNDYGIWEVTGNEIYMTGGQGMWGSFIDENNMVGTIIDMEGKSAAWTAYKIGDIAPAFDIVGDWTMEFEINGIQRFQDFTVGANGMAEVTWVKYQDMNQPGFPVTYEGTPGQAEFYTVNVAGDHIIMESVDGSLTLEGDASYNAGGFWEIVGAYTNNDTAETGDWYVVSQ